MATTGINELTDVAGAAAAVYTLTAKNKQFVVKNTHATQTLTVRPFTGATSALAAAAAAATPAAIGASENFTIPPGGRVAVIKTNRSVFCSVSAIASGAGTGILLEGTPWKD